MSVTNSVCKTDGKILDECDSVQNGREDTRWVWPCVQNRRKRY